VHLTLSHQDLADSDLGPICAILKGDYSCISAPDSCDAHPSVRGDAASAAHDFCVLERISRAGIASLDLSGNRITDAGLQLMASCFNVSTVRFIGLKFNPCQAMPLLTTDIAWTNLSPIAPVPCMRRTGSSARAPQDNSCAPPLFKSAKQGIIGLDKAKSETIFISSGGASISISYPEKPNRGIASSKRFKNNTVHPE
jgi:hypothetical protein